ncbi:MAG: hypothetical protein COA65_07610 [Rhodospirillaceae bacterium]|nr:MAG: hypothetical protein COA65_07610 [Rhodospirillaceae bacterium]
MIQNATGEGFMSKNSAIPKAIPALPKTSLPDRPPPHPVLESPLPKLEIRKTDPQGAGHFGARRNGGRRKHLGIDLVAPPGTPVTSPLDGTVTRLGWPYGDDPSYRYVEVTTGTGLVARHFYVAPSVTLGETVTAGKSCLGTVQDLTKRYPHITNHLHLEIRQADDPARRDHRPRDANGQTANLYKTYPVIDPTYLLPKQA